MTVPRQEASICYMWRRKAKTFMAKALLLCTMLAAGQATCAQQAAPSTPPASTPPASASQSGEQRTLVVGSDIYPQITAPLDQSRFDRSSNLLVNALAARSGFFGAAARDGLTWANRYVPGTDQNGVVQLYSLSTTGNYGAFLGARSSDNSSPRAENVIGSINLVVADGKGPHRHWATYSEGYVPQGSTAFRLLINDENSIQNESAPAPFADPYDVNPEHLLNSLRLDCGIGMGNPQSCTNPLSILNNGANYRVGIVFGENSLELVNGAANAVALPTNYALSWYGAPGQPAWRVYSTARKAGAGRLVMTDEAVSIDVGQGAPVPALRVDQESIASPAMIATGRPPTMSGTCGVRDQHGGNTAGAFTLTQDCSAGTIVIGFSKHAPTGWSCFATNLARGESILRETAYDGNSATLTVSGARRDDSAVFSCTGF